MFVRPRFRAPSNGQCFVNRLPNEVLEMVFVLSIPDSLIDPTPGTGADHPLTISVDAGTESCTILIFPPFKGNLPRLRRLCLNFNHRRSCDFPLPLLAPSELPTPMLETVHIHCGADQRSTTSTNVLGYLQRLAMEYKSEHKQPLPAFHSASRLTSFSFEGLRHVIFESPLLLEPADLPFANMTCVRLPEAPCYSIHVFKFMTLMPHLATFRCTLYEVEAHGQRGLLEAQTPWDTINTVFPRLVDLHVVLATQPMDQDRQPQGVAGLECFFGALTAPALLSLTIARRVHLGQTPLEYIEPAGLLVPALQGFIQRSQCTITEFELATFGPEMPELVGALELMPALRTLRLISTMTTLDAYLLLYTLAQCTSEGLPELVPQLRCLVIDIARIQTYFKNSSILDMVEARWPVGWSEEGLAHVKVAHIKSGEGSPEAESRYQERLEAMMRGREDIELDIQECVEEEPDEDEDDLYPYF
ncbi:hypothetical protein EV121DRAFT_296380 [Schizophyllum commune]